MSEAPRVLLLALGSACFASFCWGLRWHFRTPAATPLGMQLVVLLSLGGFAWFARDVGNGPLGPAWPVAALLLAMAFVVFGAAVRASKVAHLTVAFATDQPQVLIQQGPYRLVRHPFYSAYLTYWVATALARPGWEPWLLVAVFWVVYWHAGSLEEAKFARSHLAPHYASYRRKTGMFVPRASLLARLTGL